MWAAYEQLIGPGRWIRKQSIGGTIPVRFPSEADPGDAGWHIDSSFRRADYEPWRVNVHSRGRGLLALFLLTDVGPYDAPTRLLRGSHMDIPRVLARFGEDGIESVGQDLMPAGTFDREVIYATGRAGDVFLCHPFLVHAASWPHRGTRPRMLAQPEVPLSPFGSQFALTGGGDIYPVERTILDALR